MNLLEEVGVLLQQYSSGQNQAPPKQVEQHYEQVAQAIPRSTVASGLADAFRSGAAGGFGQIVSQLFGNSAGDQQASVLNTLLATAGPALLNNALSSGNIPSLAAVLGGGPPRQLSPKEAAQVPPSEVQHLANQVHSQNPSILDRVSEIYAEHPRVVKTLGSAALAIAMAKIAQRTQR